MTDHPAVVLAINPGSSSLKAVLRDPAPALTVGIERLGTDQARWTATAAGQAPASGPFLGYLPAAITHLAELLTRRGVRPDAVAHRVVHDGPSFDRPTADEAAVMDREARALLTTSVGAAGARPGPRRRLHPAT